MIARLVTRSLLLVALLAVACGEHTGSEEDAGEVFDAALAEGGVRPGDAAAGDASSFFDGSIADGGMGLSVCRGSDCDPRSPTSCGADAGLCVLRDRTPVCAEEIGQRALGEECTAESDCGPTLACFAEGVGTGVCDRICCPDDRGACGDEREVECRPQAALLSGVTTEWGRCAPVRTCDVLAMPSDCGPGEGCYIETTPPRAVCRWAGTADVGEPCTEARDCRAGFFCGGVATRTCVRVCDLDEACPRDEGRCVAQAYSPPGSGVCVR